MVAADRVELKKANEKLIWVEEPKMNNVAIAVAHERNAVALLDAEGNIPFDHATKIGYIHYKQFVEDSFKPLYERYKKPTKSPERVVLSFSKSGSEDIDRLLVLNNHVCLPTCMNSNGRAL
jgi:hypothetical protein